MARRCKINYCYNFERVSYSKARGIAKRAGLLERFNAARRVACRRDRRGDALKWAKDTPGGGRLELSNITLCM